MQGKTVIKTHDYLVIMSTVGQDEFNSAFGADTEEEGWIRGHEERIGYTTSDTVIHDDGQIEFVNHQYHHNPDWLNERIDVLKWEDVIWYIGDGHDDPEPFWFPEVPDDIPQTESSLDILMVEIDHLLT